MEIARHWRLRQQRLRLTGKRCEKGHYSFPPRDVCNQCIDPTEQPINIIQGNGRKKGIDVNTIFSSPEVSQDPSSSR